MKFNLKKLREMRNVSISCMAILLLFLQHANSQPLKTVITENFDGSSITLTASPGAAWKQDAAYFMSPLYSFRGRVPNQMGDSIVLQTPAYDFTGLYEAGSSVNKN